MWDQSCSFQHKGRIKKDIFLPSRVKSRLWTDIRDSFTFTRPSPDTEAEEEAAASKEQQLRGGAWILTRRPAGDTTRRHLGYKKK